MNVHIVGAIAAIETIAVGNSIRELETMAPPA